MASPLPQIIIAQGSANALLFPNMGKSEILPVNPFWNAKLGVWDLTNLSILSVNTYFPDGTPHVVDNYLAPGVLFDYTTGALRMTFRDLGKGGGFGDLTKPTLYVAFDSALSPSSVQTIDVETSTRCSMMMRNGQVSIAYQKSVPDGQQPTLSIAQLTFPQPSGASSPVWTHIDIVPDRRPSWPTLEYLTWPTFAYVDGFTAVHVVEVDSQGELNHDTARIIINSISTGNFDTLQTNASIQWAVYEIDGLNPSLESGVATAIVQGAGTPGEPLPPPLLYCFYHQAGSGKAFSYFSVPLKGSTDMNYGALDVSAGATSIQATNITSVDSASHYTTADDPPQYQPGYVGEEYDPAVVQVGGAIYVFYSVKIAQTLNVGLGWASQTIDPQGNLSKQGWYNRWQLLPADYSTHISATLAPTGWLG